MRRVFVDIYRTNAWGGQESVSGPGSGIERTREIRTDLERLVRRLGVRTLLDAPCGDFHWMKEADLGLERYVGVDVVPGLVESNRRLHGSASREFRLLDMTRDALPRADLVLCRDGLVHFSLADARRALRRIRESGSTYLLATTFASRAENPDIRTGGWRPLNLEAAPFGFPPPRESIDERCPADGGAYADKRLGLWRVSDITS
jgi:hypothetical protein